MPVPKGWSTVKLKSATIKRLELFKQRLKQDTEHLSFDGVINFLLDEHYRAL